jgi:hypothetical protein
MRKVPLALMMGEPRDAAAIEAGPVTMWAP